jgi:DNA polymerase-3 subunit delta
MLFLFLAPDEFLFGQRLSQLKKALGDAEMASLNLTELEGARSSAADILYHAGTMPFLAERRLIVVRGYLANLESRLGTAKTPNKAAQDEARQILAGMADQSVANDLVFIEEKLDKRRAIWRGMGDLAGIEQLSKEGQLAIEELSTPDARQMPGWIAKSARRDGIAIEGRAVQMLAVFVGPDLRRLSLEMEKLRTYASGRSITPADVQLLVSDASEALIWDLTDAIGLRDGRKAMRALYALRRNDANPFYLLTMITRQYRIMIKVKDETARLPGNEYDVAGRVGESPFPVKKAMAQSRNYALVQLEGIMDRLLKSDFAMKSGADPDTELDILVAELTQPL